MSFKVNFPMYLSQYVFASSLGVTKNQKNAPKAEPDEAPDAKPDKAPNAKPDEEPPEVGVEAVLCAEYCRFACRFVLGCMDKPAQ